MSVAIEAEYAPTYTPALTVLTTQFDLFVVHHGFAGHRVR
jgi:hypothetical protein